MQTNVYDIETAPAENVVDLIHKFYPFDAGNVKFGNLKDPVKIKAKIAEEREKHIPTMKEKAQLDPLLSYVCAIGILEEDGTITIKTALSKDGEKAILEWFWQEMKSSWTNGYTRWVGFNSNEFDIKYLFKRSWMTGVHPFYSVFKGRWIDDRMVDLMKQWTFHGYNEYASLENVTKWLGCQDPDRPDGVSGKDFYKLLREDADLALRYLKSDLKETMSIANKILNPLR